MRKQTETNRRMKRLALLSACCIAALPGVAAAQDGQGSAGEDDDNIIVTGSRATTATKTDTPILRIPQSIEVVTVEEMQDRGAQNIREALKYTAGVYSGSDDSRGDFNQVRGFESILFVDGLKRNYGFVYMPRPEIFTLEKVEVLVGPASVLYGSGSSAGLTNMQSKRPQFEFGGSASLSYGTHNRKEAAADVTGPLSDTLAVRLLGVVRDSDSRMDRTPNDRQVVQGAITWKPTPSTDITAIGIYQHDKNPPNYNIVPLINSLYSRGGSNNLDRFVPDSRFFGEPTINKGNKTYKAVSLLASHDFNDWLSFRSNTRYTWADTQQAEVYLNPSSTGNPLNPFIGATTTVARNLFAINIEYNVFNTDNSLAVNFDTGPLSHKVLGGVDYSYFKQYSRQAFTATTPIDIFNPVYGTAPAPVFAAPITQVLKQTGFYIQDQIDWGEFASLVVGLRRDRYTKDQTNAVQEATSRTTKRAGLTVNVTKTLAPYVSYSESFLPISGLNQFNSSYVPLSGEQLEFGVKWQPVPSAMIRVSYYDLTEANSLRVDPVNPLFRIQSGSITSRGLEVQANYRTKTFSVIAAFTKAKSKVSDQTYQRDNVPKTLASIYGTKTIELTGDMALRVGGGVRYQGKMTSTRPFTPPATASTFIVETPSTTLVDAMAAIDYKNWTLQVNSVNLLNTRYYPACSYFGSCSNGEPRTVQATLSFRF
jgi:iron complex outermembrane receptor protein